jgi:Mor family transcriptional regulator
MNLPKLTIHEANELRRQFLRGWSINGLSRHYELHKNSVKAILRGETYNRDSEWSNLLAERDKKALF